MTVISTDPICAQYRFGIPLRAMTARGWCSATIYRAGDPDFAFSPRFPVLVQRHVGLDDATVDLIRGNDSRLVHDVDDLLWAIPPHNPNVHQLTPALLRDMQRSMRRADLVTASTQPLADALAKGGVPSVVVPNLLDPLDWPEPAEPADRTRLRVGWYGQSNVHAEDLKIIDAVVRELVDEVDFVFYGDVPAGIDAHGALETYCATSIELFPATLATLDLDILLSPLAINAFNECKSNLRLLQAGMLGYAVIATDIEPHRTLPVTLVANGAAAWIAAIRERIGEREAVRREGEALREAVRMRYTIDDAWAQRIFAHWTGETLTPA